MVTESAPELLFFNGIDGDSGEYDIPPMSTEDFSTFIQGESPPDNLNELRFRFQQETQEHLGVKEGIDPKNLAEAGWGVIFAHDADPAVKEALSELLALRESQAGEHYKIYEGPKAHRPNESKSKFLARHGAGPGPANPEQVPYYLLIVGSPERIPYRFQTQLDVQYAVGRIHFDTLDEYANYARSVVESETKPLKLPRQITLFGVANEDDRATQLSASKLIEPVGTNLVEGQPDWTINSFLREDATKDQLAALLGGEQTPALLFSASHGMKFPLGSARQLPHQGALLCQDWPGPQQWHAEIPQDFYFAGDDLSSDSNLLGLIAFFFACYGAGTPLLDDFAKQAFKNREEIAPHAFLAQLPAKMLSNPRGGALAVIGHVERAWGYSFLWPKVGEQTEVFESTIRQLLKGHPVGSAVEFFNERYAELSTVLTDELEEIEFGKAADPFDLSGLWTANNDARGYAIIGDPAVRLPVVESNGAITKRPVIEVAAVGAVSANPSGGGSQAETEENDAVDDKNVGTGDEAGSNFAAPSQSGVLDSGGLQPDADADLKLITVATFTTTDMEDPDANATTAAVTQLSLDGDLETVLSQDTATDNEDILALHQSMVSEAVAARLAYLKLLRKTEQEN